MYPVQHKCLHNMLTFLRRVLELDGREYAKIAGYVAVYRIADEAAGVRTNWLMLHCRICCPRCFWGR
jgi:hypothetical protein